ncbi:MAG: type IV secretory system conjugative DNA transfer family protein [Erysipelotrichales bacterium]|nr:type IV secretory system conjugative DNA transfer family protein [Erysipelotrichales bacterium]
MEINELLQDYENTKIINYKDTKFPFPNVVNYDDLANHEITGVLKINRIVDGKLVQTYSTNDNHVAVIAATRLGKTTSYVIPTILSFAMQKVKRSMIVSDPKGELYRLTAAKLKALGYDVKLLNFRNFRHSESWNPLTKIYRKYRKAIEMVKDVEKLNKESFPMEYEDKMYNTKKELKTAVNRLSKYLLDEVEYDIDSIVAMFVVKQNQNDPYWEECASEVLKAFLWAMLEDSNKEYNAITEYTYSFSTILSIMTTFKSDESSDFDRGYFTLRRNSKAYDIASGAIINNAKNTRNCVLSSLNSKLALFRDVSIRNITNCNSFEIEDILKRPTVIFINYRDELKIHYNIISLFVQNAYCAFIDHANENMNGKLDIPFYFILDEFGNFPALRDFETTISACAGRNIFFILIIQSYAQLNNVYGKAVAEIIRDNLNMHVFFGSNNPETLKMFSEECGLRTRISPISALNGSSENIQNYQIETIPAVTKSRLSHFEPGECIITEANCGYVLFSRLERYYLCDEFNKLPLSWEKDYKCNIDYDDKKFNYKPDTPPRSKYSFDELW